jgi:hypothetical protein
MLDELVEITERVKYTIWEALANTGGIMGFIFLIAEILIGGA